MKPHLRYTAVVAALAAMASPGLPPAAAAGSAPVPKSQKTVIDVAVGYTPAAVMGLRDGSGSLEQRLNPDSRWHPREMKDEIKAAARQMNETLANSGVDARVRIVHTFEVPLYVGNENPMELAEDLRLGKGQAGKLAHQVREQSHADLVSVWTNPGLRRQPGALTGTGNMPMDPSAPEKLAPVKVTPRTDAYAYSAIDVFLAHEKGPGFTHELGHNLGLSHDKATLEWQIAHVLPHFAEENGASESDVKAIEEQLRNEDTPPYETGRGFVTPDAKYFTAMSYVQVCKEHAKKIGAGPDSCRYSGTYASPDLHTKDQDGQKLGDSTSDQVKVLRETAPIVAGYRSASDVALATRTRPDLPDARVEVSPAPPHKKGQRLTLTAVAPDSWKLRRWHVGKNPKAAKNPLRLPYQGQTVTAEFTCEIGVVGGGVGKEWKKLEAAALRDRKSLLLLEQVGCPIAPAVRKKNGNVSQEFDGGVFFWDARTKKATFDPDA
ncbi:hypothetical protein ACFQVC_32490 [Streptomyces monticola]|uniref:Uncharacterized protein n=1 Tax=Streptomyces monticola TaxID=2666263 RepID=A0ABW2JUB8_9ACTN